MQAYPTCSLIGQLGWTSHAIQAIA